MSEQAIVLNELTKHYGKHRGINNLSFSVSQGSFRLYRPQQCVHHNPHLMGDPSHRRQCIIFGRTVTQGQRHCQGCGLSLENSYENMKVRELLQYTADLCGMDCKAE
ncbi:MAG: ABC transporter ATP-binding protein [Eubacteriales bacterium]